MTIRKNGDEQMPLSITLGGEKENQFRSTVYKTKSPRWMELVKITLPPLDFSKCHLLFTFRSRMSGESKDKLEKEFAFCWLPLKDQDDLTIQNSNYRLIVYRCSDMKKLKYINYCTLPSIHSDDTDLLVSSRTEGIHFTKG